jgi:hypothetical protein
MIMATTLRVIAAIFGAAAVPLAIFCYWGLFTAEGMHAYDEMDGYIPFFAGVLAAMLAVVAALGWWLGGRLRR